jgi:hypothetical protein
VCAVAGSSHRRYSIALPSIDYARSSDAMRLNHERSLTMANETEQNEAEPMGSSIEYVRRRAYELYEQRGRADGHDWEDWLEAERQLRPAASTGRKAGRRRTDLQD